MIHYIKPKLTKFTATLFIAIAVALLFSLPVRSAGGSGTIRFTYSPASAVADGVSRINVTVESIYYICNDGDFVNKISECDTPEKMGYSGTEGKDAVDHAYLSSDPELTISVSDVQILAAEPGQFYVTSSTVGTFDIYEVYPTGELIKKYPVTFTAPSPPPASTPAPSSTTSSPHATPQTATPTEKTEATKPKTPTAKLLGADGSEIKPKEGDEKVSYNEKEPIVLSGNTVPNGLVKLYIFSEPQEAEVTADENGDWTYTIASIEPGDHRVEIEVTDPESGETSDRAEVLSFQVAQSDITGEGDSVTEQIDAAVTSSKVSRLLVPLIAIGSIFTVLALALLIVSKMHPIKYISHLIKH